MRYVRIALTIAPTLIVLSLFMVMPAFAEGTQDAVNRSCSGSTNTSDLLIKTVAPWIGLAVVAGTVAVLFNFDRLHGLLTQVMSNMSQTAMSVIIGLGAAAPLAGVLTLALSIPACPGQ